MSLPQPIQKSVYTIISPPSPTHCFPTLSLPPLPTASPLSLSLPIPTDLTCMYNLFARVDDGLQWMIKYLSAHLRESGRRVVSEEPGSENSPGRNATTFIQNLLDLRDQYSMFLEKSFSGDSTFKHSIGQVMSTKVSGILKVLLLSCFSLRRTLWITIYNYITVLKKFKKINE